MPQCDVDSIATHLLRWGEQARAMPPSWDGACIAHPICGPQGQPIGRMLPGRGLYLDHDLKSLGITRNRARLRSVYEPSVIRHASELFARASGALHVLAEDERGAITSYDNIINARANGNAEDRSVLKASFTTVANQWSSLWQAGGVPAAGAYTSTPGTAPNNATTGALSFGLSTPGSGNKYLLTFGYTAAQAINMLILHDLLVQCGGLSAASSANQAVTPAALTRYTNGKGVMALCDVSSAIGTTASNIVLTYTNQGGASSTQATPSVAMTPSMIVQRTFPAGQPFFTLQSGDYGVETVTNVKLSAAMTTGTFAINLYYPLMFIPGLVANIWTEADSTIQIDGLAQLVIGSDSAIGCLNAYVQTNTTSTGTVVGFMRTCSG
jgi:hypothetical protein